MHPKRQASKEPLFFNAPISQFEGIKPHPLDITPTANQVIEYLSSNERLHTDIEKAREYLQQELEADERDNKGKLLLRRYNAAKCTLPGVTWAGTFTRRSNAHLIQFSGFLSFDIDFIDKDNPNPVSFAVEKAKALTAFKTLQADKYSSLLFHSVSSAGVKGLIKIPSVTSDAQYKSYFKAYQKYTQQQYGIILDSLPDISRLCFLSFQKNPYVNKTSELFTETLSDQEEEPPPRQKEPKDSKHDPSIKAALAVLIRYGISHSISRNDFVGICGLFKRLNIVYETFDTIMKKSPGYDQKENFRIWNTIDTNEQCQKPKTVSTLIQYAREANKSLFTDLRRDYKEQQEPESDDRKPPGMATLIKRKLATRYEFKLNSVSDKIIVMTKESSRLMSDFIESEIRCWLMDEGFSKRDAISDVIKASAYQNQFHPIEEYFRGLTWDKVDRFSEIGTFFVDHDNIFPHIFKAWCVGAIRRVFTGEHHQVLIFAGAQGKGKSFFGRWLCPLPEYHLEQSIKPETNDAQIRLSENFIWEVVEFGSTTRKADIDALKNFISQEHPTYRRSHDKYDQKKKALASFIGTVNLDGAGFLNDPTGHRRWWPVELKHIDFAYSTSIDLHQLWAQAYFLFQTDCLASCQINDGVQEQINRNIESEFATRNPMEDIILQVFEFTGKDTDFLLTTEILVELARNGYQRTNHRADSMVLSKALRLLQSQGYSVKKGRQRKGNGPRGYLGIRRVSDDN